MSIMQVDQLTSASGTGAPACPNGVTGSGGFFTEIANQTNDGAPHFAFGAKGTSADFDTIANAAGTGAPNFSHGATLPTTPAGNVYSGTYNPAITSVGGSINLTINNIFQAFYTRLGNVVTVAGAFDASAPGGTGDFIVIISIPTGGVFSAGNQAGGVITTWNLTTSESARVIAYNPLASVYGVGSTSTASSKTYSYVFMYAVQ